MSIFFYNDEGWDMGGGEWWNFFPPEPDFSAESESGEDAGEYRGEGGAIPPEPDYEEGPFYGGELDWYSYADGMIDAIMRDAASVAPRDLRGGGFSDVYEAFEWLERTRLLGIGEITEIDGLFYPVVGDTGPTKK